MNEKFKEHLVILLDQLANSSHIWGIRAMNSFFILLENTNDLWLKEEFRKIKLKVCEEEPSPEPAKVLQTLVELNILPPEDTVATCPRCGTCPIHKRTFLGGHELLCRQDHKVISSGLRGELALAQAGWNSVVKLFETQKGAKNNATNSIYKPLGCYR